MLMTVSLEKLLFAHLCLLESLFKIAGRITSDGLSPSLTGTQPVIRPSENVVYFIGSVFISSPPRQAEGRLHLSTSSILIFTEETSWSLLVTPVCILMNSWMQKKKKAIWMNVGCVSYQSGSFFFFYWQACTKTVSLLSLCNCSCCK